MIRMIKRDNEDGTARYGPVLTCAVCQRPIENIALALYKWQQDEQGQPAAHSLVILHKGACDEAHNRAHNAGRWPWSEGTAFLGYLVNASQMTSERHLWPWLISHYCPDDQLEEVQKVAEWILKDPDNRPPGLHDL